jgi:hypothetical protein
VATSPTQCGGFFCDPSTWIVEHPAVTGSEANPPAPLIPDEYLLRCPGAT